MSSSYENTKKLKQKSPKNISHKLKSESKLSMNSEQQQKRLNENFMDLMKTLAYIMRKKKDFMRAKAYENAYESIGRIKNDILHPSSLNLVTM